MILRIEPEIKIVFYVLFVIALFVLNNAVIYSLIFVLLCVLSLKVSFRTLKSGWAPIGLFLIFTFISNVLNRHGKILFARGPLIITDEGLSIALLRTVRVLFMIIGAKILMSSAKPEDIIRALGRLMSPLERLGLPVADFFHTMGLTVKCFPALKDMASEIYRENIRSAEAKGFLGRARVTASFLLPMFVKSVQSPEVFFEKGKDI